MPELVVTNFNIVCATLGGFITLFGLISFLLKENFYLSEALISMLAGIVFSPHALGWLRPEEYALSSEANLDQITLYFSRLVLGIQLVIAGVQLPSRYLRTEWRSLALLLGPGMTIMWISASLLIWAMVPHINILQALAIGACITPTDPVLSNSIVKGKFADSNIPRKLQKIIIAESGANDGLGYPFLFLALYLIHYNGENNMPGQGHGLGLWFGETWGYTIILSVLYGIVVGWIAKELLHFCEERKYVDRESFLVFAITLALFITGTCGMVGSDDVLACFVAGNVFTWDDWFRMETEDDSLQPTIDMLLNIVVFMWYGAVAPWAEFGHNEIIPTWRLVLLALLILLFRRIPMIMAFWRHMREIDDWQQALFAGYFGPIGVSAVFYLYISIDFLEKIVVDGQVRPDAAYLAEVMRIVVWFMAISSIVAHGLSVPLGKLGYNMPRTLSQALSSDNEQSRSNLTSRDRSNEPQLRKRRGTSRIGAPQAITFSLSRNELQSQNNSTSSKVEHTCEEPRRPVRILSDEEAEDLASSSRQRDLETGLPARP